ncbi:MAG TPA: hypothetical protein VES02_13345 [Dermatophilaceae bacterium]|nr:hypothetical protein [Dermatophilaceae bacterium]
MHLHQSMILMRARTDEFSRPGEAPSTAAPPARIRGALRIKLDARLARRENPAG